MLHAGLDLSRTRLDYCLLDAVGDRVEVGDIAGGQVVDDAHGGAHRDELLRDVRTDETGAAGYETTRGRIDQGHFLETGVKVGGRRQLCFPRAELTIQDAVKVSFVVSAGGA